MTRSHVERAVARATGESLSTIQRLGFSLIETGPGDFDDAPTVPNVVDWDALHEQKLGLFPIRRQRMSLAA